MVTIVDVAHKANVSTSTVSHVINETRFVSKEVTERVFRAIEELGYQPNVVARSLRTKKSRIIGVVVSDITNPFFTTTVRAIEDEALNHNYNIILCDTDEQPKREKKYLDILMTRRVDGVIVSPSSENETVIAEIVEAGVPVVLLDREIADLAVDIVECDNEGGGFQAVDYLIGQGHNRIAIICGRQDVSTGIHRLAGYRRAFAQHGLEVDPSLIKRADFRRDLAFEKTLRLLDSDYRPTALFACNNVMTLGAISAIRSIGLRIPRDISVVGFDDPEWASLMDPPLTVVSQAAHQLGAKAIQLLVKRIRDGARNRQTRITFPVELVKRASCRSLNGS